MSLALTSNDTRDNAETLKLDLGLDFSSSFSLDFEVGNFDIESKGPSPAVASSPIISSPVASSKSLTRSASAAALASTNASRTLSHSPSLPSLASAPTPSPTAPTAPSLSHAVKGVLLTPSDAAPAVAPPVGVTFALPLSTGRPPRLPQTAKGPAKRRIQVGAFGDISWVTEPERRHTQAPLKTQEHDHLTPLRRATAAGSSSTDGPSRRNRGRIANDSSKDWLIEHHLQQLHAFERDRQKEIELAKRLTPSPLPRDMTSRSRLPSGLPSITEEATRPPRSTSLHVMTSSTSLEVPPPPSTSLNAGHRRIASDSRVRSPTRPLASSATRTTSPLAQTPITRTPSHDSPRPAVSALPASRPQRNGSIFGFTMRKLDFGRSKHSRSNSQSSKLSVASQVSDISSEESAKSRSSAETAAAPQNPSAVSADRMSNDNRFPSSSSLASATSDKSSSFQTRHITASTDMSPPQTPRSSSPASTGSATTTSSLSPTTPGTPESEVVRTPHSPIPLYSRPWDCKEQEVHLEPASMRQNVGVSF